MGLSAKDTWTFGLLALSCVAFLAAARWPTAFAGLRSLVIYSVGFSLGFVALAILSGLAVVH